jgi:hypothetical protein
MTAQTELEKALLDQKITSALTKRNLTAVAVKDAAAAKRKKRAARNKLHAKVTA